MDENGSAPRIAPDGKHSAVISECRKEEGKRRKEVKRREGWRSFQGKTEILITMDSTKE